MTKSLSKNLLASPAVFRAMLVVSAAAMPGVGNPLLARQKPATSEVTQPLVAESPNKGAATTFLATPLNPETQVANNTKNASEKLLNAEVDLSGTSITPAPETPSFVDPNSQDNQSIDENNALKHVTSVSQLSDVQPTDWGMCCRYVVDIAGTYAGQESARR
jgi:hypothetical protein